MNNKDKINRYLNYLEADPENATLMISIGDLYHADGLFEEAERYFREALSTAENRSVALGRLCNVQLSQNLPEEALKGYLELVRSGEDAPQIHHNIALCHLVQYRLDAAFDIFQALVDETDTGQSALFYLAVIHQIRGDSDQAFRIASDLAERHKTPFYLGYLATLHYARGSIDKSIQLARSVLETDSSNADSYSVLGTYSLEQLNTQDAVANFTRITELFPADARGWHGLGLVELQQRDIEAAITLLHKASNLLPRNAGMRVSLAWAHYINQDYTTAVESFRNAIEVSQSFAESWGGLSCALVMLGETREAEHACDTALKLDRRSFGGIYAKALLLNSKGKETRSTELLAGMLDTPIRPGGKTLTDAVQQYLKQQQISFSPTQSSNKPRVH